jgi:hypothetical protein
MSKATISRTEKIARIVEALDVTTIIEVQLMAARDHSVQLMKLANDDAKRAYEDSLTPETVAAIERANDALLKELVDLWDSEKLRSVFQAEYGHNMTDAELDEVLAYYTSPVGQKDVAASHLAIAHMTGYLVNSQQRAYPRLVKKHREHVERILRTLD